MRHSKLTTVEGIHTVIAYTYADAAARTGATGFTAQDVGKIAKQLDTGTYWILEAITPTWSQVALGGTVTLASTAPEDVTKAAAAVGVGTTAARADHKHNVSTATAGASAPGDTAAEGTATSLSRSDHRHSLPAFGSSTGTFCQGDDSRLSNDRVASGLRTATTVVGISTAAAPAAGQVLTATSTTDAAWSTPAAGVSLASTAPEDVTKAAAAVGVGTTAARADHKHNISAAAPSTLAAGGSNTEGTATSLARSDHVHALPAYGSSSGTFCQGNDSRLSDARAPTAHASTHLPGGSDALTTGTPSNVGTANAAGTATSLVRSDHVHALPFSVVQTVLGTATGSVGFNSQTLSSVANPVNPQDVATKSYVDAMAVGLDVKPSVTAIAVANVATMSGTAQTVDGVALNSVGMRVLLVAQSTSTQDGIWVVAAGAWTRSLDMPVGSDAAGAFTFVEQGTLYAESGWVCTNNTGSAVVGTNDLVFTQFSGAGQITAGDGLTKTGNTINVVAHADGSIVVTADAVQVGVITNTQHGTRTGGTLHNLASSTSAGFLPQSNFAATTDPTVSNDNTQGYAAGSIWLNVTAGTTWHAMSVATGAAVWRKMLNAIAGFSNGGEAGGANRTLGNTDNFSLAFLTNNTQRLLINANGSIVATASTAAADALIIQGAAAQTGDLLLFRNSSGTELSCVTNVGWINIAGASVPFPTSPFFVSLDAGNSYLQIQARNTNAGNAASSDYVATANNGSDTTFYVDMGINSSTYNQAAYNITVANDSYLLAVGGHLAVGTATATKTIKFHTAGTTTSQLRATITDTALVMNTLPIQGVVDPTNAQDAATKAYVDSHSGSGSDIGYKLYAVVATTANITLSGTQTIDGVAVTAGQRVLVKNQTTGSGNGLYLCAAGAWTRTTDMDSSALCDAGVTVCIRRGTVNAGTEWWLATQPAITLGTTALVFAQLGTTLLRQTMAASDFDDPGTDWSVSAPAGLAADTVNAAVIIRRFDDTTEEGVGWTTIIPATATQVRFTTMSKAVSSPSAPARTVGLALKKREVPDNAGLGGWSSSTLSDVNITNDVSFHRQSQTFTLATLSLTADRIYQLELTRQNPAAGSELPGDWGLFLLVVEWLS